MEVSGQESQNKSYLLYFNLERSDKSWTIQNESVHVYTKYDSNQSLFTQLSLHFLAVILIFTIFSCSFL